MTKALFGALLLTAAAVLAGCADAGDEAEIDDTTTAGGGGWTPRDTATTETEMTNETTTAGTGGTGGGTTARAH